MVNKGDKFLATSIIAGVESQIVIYKGIQETGFDKFPPFVIYNLTQDIPGHPKDSTISRDTLYESGFILPVGAP